MIEPQALADLLRSKFAIGMKLSWIIECLSFLKAQHSTEINRWSHDQLTEAVFGQFLLSDLNNAGDGVLPPGVEVRSWPSRFGSCVRVVRHPRHFDDALAGHARRASAW